MNNRIEVIVRECIPCQEYMASQAAQPHIPFIASRIQEILDCDLCEASSKQRLSGGQIFWIFMG